MPTPIGNLGDLTFRALATLQACDFILAEDTRVTRRLCQHYGITTPLRSHHQFSEATQLEGILSELQAGQHLALVSDAGTPGLSDPGGRLIRAVQADPTLTLEVLPGATAITTALLAAGFAEQPFAFWGFVPRKHGERQQLWDRLRTAPQVAVCYEAPSRIRKSLLEAAEALGPDREGAIAKELTKIHELVLRGPLGTLAARLPVANERGEFVLLIGPAPTADTPALAALPEPADLAAMLIAAGASPRGARDMLASLTGLSGSRAYDLLREAQTHARAHAT